MCPFTVNINQIPRQTSVSHQSHFMLNFFYMCILPNGCFLLWVIKRVIGSKLLVQCVYLWLIESKFGQECLILGMWFWCSEFLYAMADWFGNGKSSTQWWTNRLILYQFAFCLLTTDICYAFHVLITSQFHSAALHFKWMPELSNEFVDLLSILFTMIILFMTFRCHQLLLTIDIFHQVIRVLM